MRQRRRQFDQRRARNDRHRHQQRQSMFVLRGRPRGGIADLRKKTPHCRPIGGQLPHGRHHPAPKSHARLCHEGSMQRSYEINDADFATLHAHGFDDEDIWDIAAITAFFGLSNRLVVPPACNPTPSLPDGPRSPRENALRLGMPLGKHPRLERVPKGINTAPIFGNSIRPIVLFFQLQETLSHDQRRDPGPVRPPRSHGIRRGDRRRRPRLAWPQPSASSNWRPKKARMSRWWCWKKALSRAPTPCRAPSWTRRP